MATSAGVTMSNREPFWAATMPPAASSAAIRIASTAQARAASKALVSIAVGRLNDRIPQQPWGNATQVGRTIGGLTASCKAPIPRRHRE